MINAALVFAKSTEPVEEQFRACTGVSHDIFAAVFAKYVDTLHDP